MKTILAAFVSLAFLAPAALACPGHDGAEAKTVKKEETTPPKTATAKPAPKAQPTAPATVKPVKATPKAAVGSKSEQGKVSAN